MKNKRSIFHAGKLFAFAVAGWLLSSGFLFAKDGEKSESSGGSWVLSFFLVLLGIVLGMLVVCRTSTRRDRVKPEAYVKDKVGVKGENE